MIHNWKFHWIIEFKIEFKKGKSYNFERIKTYSSVNDGELLEMGEIIGKAFIVLETPYELYSFILNDYNSVEGNLYECVFAQ